MLYVKNLHKSYQSGNKSYNVLKGINLSVADQEFVAVMGPSGSGKSTLLNCISCYIPFEQGTITLGEQELRGLDENSLAKIRNEKLGFVFQDFMLLDGLTMRENILVPRIIWGEADKQAEKLADQLLALFDIEHIASKYPADVSGGERQRTAVARSLINQPLLILADEPTGNLDSKSSRAVIESFENARNKLGASIFMVTHDSFAASFCDRVILLKDGTVYDTLEAEPGHKEERRGAFQDRLLGAIREMSNMEDSL
ncbi:ABC transporter ATP-binding protein [Parablautia muri]|uniref:ABC transporter ATP-binding protein n=1 Tax=Parablautia muri TaxID=2320879 RepID=A0A9X5GTR7_9FIRM|nr:ABC transporter ATP-binding protein [Parablautia muri]NBJ93282.1 ABC transporter ATP-binding protein [Parablautia muri]